ncbi:MAG: hypothetical protein ABR502_09090 [Chitinophagaceae bacterium]
MRGIFISFLFLQFLFGCNQTDRTDNTTASENDADAARNFIQSALEGEYKKAETFILPDSINNQYLDALERNYKDRMNADDKTGYRGASINIHSIKELNDSTSIIHYSNSYKNQRDSIKAVRMNNKWLVDLKYSFPSITNPSNE